MEIKGKNILILGGWGMVGSAVCRELLPHSPRQITIASLTRTQAESACAELQPYAGESILKPAWGNIFVRSELKDLSRNEILSNPDYRIMVAEDILERTTDTSFERFTLNQIIMESQPHIIIDCVNTATGVAYQDIYSAGLKILEGVKQARAGNQPADFLADVEMLLDTLYIPQLVRHVQVLYHAMKQAGTHSYIKVGTSGTGGMGLNIPYTHSEDKPSRVLLSKSSIAGAHSLLLFLMGRTPDAPAVKEVKPAAAIAWKGIRFGEVHKGGAPVRLVDCPPDAADLLEGELSVTRSEGLTELNESLNGVFIDTGENGIFSLGEFTAITTAGQMEFVTPEEIARVVVSEIIGVPTGKDIVAALDASVMSPSYRAGFMRALAIKKMRELSVAHPDGGVAFELLGPPRLSKLLYEAHLLKQAVVSLNGVLQQTPEALAQKLEAIVKTERSLRSRIISIGIPILLPDGKRLLRGRTIKVPSDPRRSRFSLSDLNINRWAENGWVDLRPANISRWQGRIKQLLQSADEWDGDDFSSRVLRDGTFWQPNTPLDEGEVVGWIFINEDKGLRIK